MRIAVVGTGIAGLAAAWLLQHRHAVTVFEADTRIGGHCRTLAVPTARGEVPVDTGFMVYNERTYPLLTRLFGHLGVATRASPMSFSASIADGSLEYGGSLQALLAQRANLLRPAFVRMLLDVLRFNRTGLRYLARPAAHDEDDGLTLGDFLARHGFGRQLGEWYLLPMAAAIWSAPVARLLDYPARSFLNFFANHGLLCIQGRPQWRTVAGGSRAYVARMAAGLRPRLHTAAVAVRRRPVGVEVVDARGTCGVFDQVVVACHADQALRLLSDPTRRERALLGAFAYQANRVVVHGDPALMPRRRRVWSSWNYLAQRPARPLARVAVTYWMNRLQSLACEEDVFVSLNPLREPDPRAVHAELEYRHPVLDRAAVAAQARLGEIQGQGGVWYAGAWTGNGFHEDGVRSGFAVARRFGAAPPWEPQPAISGSLGLVEGAAAGPA